MTVGEDIQLRPAVLTDQRQIASLIHSSAHVHQHLDWRSPIEWIGAPNFFVLESQGKIIATLNCSPDPASVAWIHLFVISEKMDVQEAWQLLWKRTQAFLLDKGRFLVAAIILHDWLQPILISSGFTRKQFVLMLERDSGTPIGSSLPPGVVIREMLPYDLPSVAEVDAAAFESLWQISFPLLQSAYSQATWATIAKKNDQVIGYQLSTRNPMGVHLARLAVSPEAQGNRIGLGLVADLIDQINGTGLSHLTVNTQSDNKTSLALYQRTGFHETGQSYPVYTLQIPS
jgi:ribosomal protein S18 acetylase RimI-like enzyme